MSDADVIIRMLHAIDRRDWAAVRDSFTDPVRTDYTSLWGGEPETQAIDELIAQWTEFLKGFGATQHLTGPLHVCGDQVETHVTAHHWRAGTGSAWVVHGHYIARLADGRIAELTLQTFHASGDPDLPHIPAQLPM
jgi:SnoaL-like domain